MLVSRTVQEILLAHPDQAEFVATATEDPPPGPEHTYLRGVRGTRGRDRGAPKALASA